MIRCLPLLLALAAWVSPALSDIPAGYRSVAAEAGIPASVLYAVALAESGRTIKVGGEKVFRPWPWTLNLGGKGRHYESREQMRSALYRYLSAGNKSADIGIMQVNWRYQKRLLKDPYRAMDPYYSLRIGAQILADCRRRAKDWHEAIGCYHSPGKSSASRQRAERYTQRVSVHLRRLDV